MKGKSLLVGLALILASATVSSAYDKDNVHPKINETAIIQSNIDNYLKKQLGFDIGIEEVFMNKKIKEWISEGGKLEDEPGYRCLKHFHDPLKPWEDAGLNSWYQSSLVWA